MEGGFYSGGTPSSSRYPRYSSRHGSINHQSNDRAWNNNYKYKSRGNSGRCGDLTDVRLACGPRADNQSNFAKSQADNEQVSFTLVERDNYNLSNFQTVYEQAKFFVIKSFCEHDVHKCIKYNVWSSTTIGNKKLDAAFREAYAKTTELSKCPVFLFFSVNMSGQFVGVAEMTGHVDFTKNMDFWQVDKWNGFFPVKWHIIKDVPSTLFQHIILKNNENKVVTNSRDTQEIELKQGLKMLSIFFEYTAKTTLLDDLIFYENREKALREKRNASQTGKSEYEGGEDGTCDGLDLGSLSLCS